MKLTIKATALLITVLTVLNMLSVLGVEAKEESGAEAIKNEHISLSKVSKDDYSDYLEKYSEFGFATNCVNADFQSEHGDLLYEKKNVAICKNRSDKVQFNVNVSEDAFYYFVLYCAFPDNNIYSDFSVLVDGKNPFSSAGDITVNAFWRNNGKTRKDDFGNELTPEQVVVDEFLPQTIKSSDGNNIRYLFAMSKGSHLIEITDFSRPLAIEKLVLEIPESLESYENTAKQYKEKMYGNYDGVPILIEGEQADIKTDRNLIPLSDNSDPNVSPSNAVISYLNYIGSTNWQTAGQRLSWNVNVKESGLYSLSFKFRQNKVTNGTSFRALYIDNSIPFYEASSVDFGYDSSWQTKKIMTKSGEECLIYLSEGQHTISLEVTLGKLQQDISDLQVVTEEIGALYRKIVMITGESVDSNRDYNLFEQIPDFNKSLKDFYNRLYKISSNIKKLSDNGKGINLSALSNMRRIIKTMYENPYKAHKYASSYYSYYCSLASQVYEITKLPLDIDYFVLSAPSKPFEEDKVGFFGQVLFSVKKLIYSYSSDYNSISKISDSEHSITIWVNWGRDQAQVLNSLIQTKFVPKHNIDVNLKLTNATLIQGMLSGNGPDCALALARSEPINLAMRNALYDLGKFKDYSDVMKRFLKDSDTAYKFRGGSYALPDSETFYMMFCRTDILEELKIEIPKTWDDFLEATAIIQRNNFQVNIGGGQANTGTNMQMFATMLLQNGGKMYSDKLDATALSDKTALEVFSDFTAYYTDYKVPITADFYNRFRTGLMPIGIQPYTMYMTLAVAAPEIKGKWCMVPIPGEVKEDGSIDNTQVPSGTGCVILEASNKKNESWEFLKWWTSAEVQLNYSENVESILGTSGRVTTSNTLALSQMLWDNNSYDMLLEQMQKLQDLPELPGGYYISRIIDQAFYNTVSNNQNPQDMLLKWSDIANGEISRKRKQYNLS